MFVNSYNVVNEEEVDDKHVEEVFDKKVPQTQRRGIQ